LHFYILLKVRVNLFQKIQKIESRCHNKIELQRDSRLMIRVAVVMKAKRVKVVVIVMIELHNNKFNK